MTEPEEHPAELSNPAMWAREIGCSVSSIDAWLRDLGDADIPPQEMDLILKFVSSLFSCDCCPNLPFSATSVPNPPSQQEQRRRRLEKRAARRARAAAARLLTYEKG